MPIAILRQFADRRSGEKMALLHTFKILVVDDQRSMRGILRQLLRSLGIDEVVEAANGAQAIELLMAAKDPDIDLIICDLFMDEMDGLAFCQNIRRSEALRKKHIPIMLLTAERDPFLLDVLRQVGVSHIAAKPISAPELRQCIEKLIGVSLTQGAPQTARGSTAPRS